MAPVSAARGSEAWRDADIGRAELVPFALHGRKTYQSDIYANDAGYFVDIASAYQEDFSILYENGCRNVQFDDPNLACKQSPFSAQSF